MATANDSRSSPRRAPRFREFKRDFFTRIAGWTIRATGGRWGFLTALLVVVVWALTGPMFDYSETWQLVINTGTSIVTFLMVFLIQNAQNRESKAIHLKLDELILRLGTARNEMIAIEHLTEEQLETIAERYVRVAEAHRHKLSKLFDKVATPCEPEHDRQDVSPPDQPQHQNGSRSPS